MPTTAHLLPDYDFMLVGTVTQGLLHVRMGDALYVARPSFAASSLLDTSAPVEDVGVIEGALSFRLGETRCFGFAVPLFTVAPSAKRPRFDKSLESVEVGGRTMLRVQDDATGRVMVLGVLNDPANCTMLHAHWEGQVYVTRPMAGRTLRELVAAACDGGGWSGYVSNLFASTPLTFTLHLRNAGGGAFQQPITAWVLGGLELA